jgi:hypothetical protein
MINAIILNLPTFYSGHTISFLRVLPTDYRPVTIDRSALAKVQRNLTAYVTVKKSEASTSVRKNALPVSSDRKMLQMQESKEKPLAFIFTVK